MSALIKHGIKELNYIEYEGNALTVLGVLTWENSANGGKHLYVSKVAGIVAGGANEYKSMIKKALKFYELRLNINRVLLGISLLALGASAYYIYFKAQNPRVNRKNTKDLFAKIKNYRR
jgi:hypothetical protein